MTTDENTKALTVSDYRTREAVTQVVVYGSTGIAFFSLAAGLPAITAVAIPMASIGILTLVRQYRRRSRRGRKK